MNDLITWLRAQLDEDERTTLVWQAKGPTEGAPTEALVHRGATWVLANIAAKRKILDLHEHTTDTWPQASWETEPKTAFGCMVCHWVDEYSRVADGGWCQTIRLLAEPYAGRDGFRKDWRA